MKESGSSNRISYVVYSHNEFKDILQIQTDYLKKVEDKILLINYNDKDLNHIYSQYKQVIFYDDELPYASRLLSLSRLDIEYVLFIHDIDILIIKNDEVINYFTNVMEKEEIDRIDLQVRYLWDLDNMDKFNTTFEGTNIELRKQTNINNFIYNVNPSIWKLSTFLDIMNKFKDETYRSIELVTQDYCSKFKIYKLFSDNYMSCGWFSCLPFFQFLHITHGGNLLPKDNNNLCEPLKLEYNTILNKWLYNTNRVFANESEDTASPMNKI